VNLPKILFYPTVDPIMQLKEQNILLGVTGGIAAYKSASICRLLVKEGARVRIAMTKNATEFVGPLTFETLSGHPVGLDMFAPHRSDKIIHIHWAEWANLFVIAPATANIIGKAASGIADDLVSSLLISVQSPIVFVPAMHHQMWENPVVQRNLKFLREMGYHVMPPETGELASGGTGAGRMPEPEQILEFLKNPEI